MYKKGSDCTLSFFSKIIYTPLGEGENENTISVFFVDANGLV
jgi:hypothetical protein